MVHLREVAVSVEKSFVNPPGLFSTKGLGFTHVVTSAPGKTIHISGQTAWNAERELVGGDDLRRQATQAFDNLRKALGAAGATPRDVVFVRLYVVGYRPEYAGVLSPMLEAFFAGGPPPGSTWIGVSALAVPGFLIEIEATAVVAA
jgi:enamine deaminase RidA (YjgF/YER057c/UK114 family)